MEQMQDLNGSEVSDGITPPAIEQESLTLRQAQDVMSEQKRKDDEAAEAKANADLAVDIDKARKMVADAQQGHKPDVAEYDWNGKPRNMPESFESPADASKFLSEPVDENTKGEEGEEAKEQAAQPERAAEDDAAESEAEPAEPEIGEIGEDGLDEPTRALWNNPMTRQAFEEKIGQLEAAQSQHANAALQAVHLATTGVMADFPELNGLSDEQASGAMALMAQTDPERHRALVGRLQQLGTLMQQHNAAAQQQDQQYRAQVAQWARSQDAGFENATKGMRESELQACANEAKHMLHEYGLTDNQITELWNNSILRSTPAQLVILDAVRYRMAKRGVEKSKEQIKAKQRANIPPVQKPGTTVEPSARKSPRLSELERKGSLSTKEAAELVTLQARRRVRA